ncbi:hypothetical protein CULCOIPH003_07790 [Corynebacterium ulcerans]|nr:hypothetical protein CULCOIPH003_07790 [Corynebacterium ulcerans]GJJ41152.1 hypothetical protein CULCOIPH004_15630 [Corynebacterium ulcerans]
MHGYGKFLGNFRVSLQTIQAKGIYLLNVKEFFPIRSLYVGTFKWFEIDVKMQGGIGRLWVVG